MYLRKKYVKDILIFIVVVIAALIYSKFKEVQFAENEVSYTEATINDIFWANGGMSCSYSYMVEQKTYQGKAFIYEHKVKRDDKFNLKYVISSPETSEILFDEMIDTSPASARTPPARPRSRP